MLELDLPKKSINHSTLPRPPPRQFFVYVRRMPRIGHWWPVSSILTDYFKSHSLCGTSVECSFNFDHCAPCAWRSRTLQPTAAHFLSCSFPVLQHYIYSQNSKIEEIYSKRQAVVFKIKGLIPEISRKKCCELWLYFSGSRLSKQYSKIYFKTCPKIWC